MIFKQFSKPKWQHEKADIRIEGVTELDSSNPDDLSTLNVIAKKDDNANVRIAALQKLDNISLVMSIAEDEADNSVIQAAKDHQLKLLQGIIKVNTDSCLQYIEQCQESKHLAEIAKYNPEPSLREAAFNKISDQTILADIALNGTISKIRQTAVSRILDQQLIEQLAKDSKNKDKSVYRLCKEKLTTAKQQAEKKLQAEKHIISLCETLEELAKHPYEPLYEQKLKHLQKQWQDEDKDIRQAYEQQFDEALQQAKPQQQIGEDMQLQASTKPAESPPPSQEHHDALELHAKINTMLTEIKATPELNDEALTQAQELTKCLPSHKQTAAFPEKFKKQFEQSKREFDEILRANERLNKEKNKLQQILQDAESPHQDKIEQCIHLQDTLKSRLRFIRWPSAYEQPELLQQTEKIITELQNNKDKLLKAINDKVAHLQQQVKKLDDEISQGALKTANRLFHSLEKNIHNIPERYGKKLYQQLNNSRQKLHNLRDWQGFAVIPKQEELCKKMDELAAEDISPQEKADCIKILHDKWKDLGASNNAKSQRLWRRFKIASDKAYEPCRVYFGEQAEIRKTNLKERDLICTELEYFLDNNNWDMANWKAVDKIIQTARQEWFKYSPVDRSAGRKLQKRFDQVMGKLHELTDQEKHENANKKTQIIQRAEQLLEYKDLNSAINQIKSLQQEWKSIGPTHRREENKLWKQFRTNCDKLFEQRDKERKQVETNLQENYQKAEILIEQISQLRSIMDQDINKTRIHFQQLQKELSIHLKNKENFRQNQHGLLLNRFKGVIRTIDKVFLDAEKRQLNVEASEIKRRVNLLNQLEALVFASEIPDQQQKIQQIESQWTSDAVLQNNKAKALEAKKQILLETLHNPDTLKTIKSAADSHYKDRKLLCIRLEILTNVETPVEDKAMRMQYQMERLAQGLGKEKNGNKKDNIDRLEIAFISSEPIPAEKADTLTERFYKILEKT